MSLAVVYSRASLGIAAPQVTVEVHLSNGLPAFNMVGLPERQSGVAYEQVSHVGDAAEVLFGPLPHEHRFRRRVLKDQPKQLCGVKAFFDAGLKPR